MISAPFSPCIQSANNAVSSNWPGLSLCKCVCWWKEIHWKPSVYMRCFYSACAVYFIKRLTWFLVAGISRHSISNALLDILYLYCMHCMTGLDACLIALEAWVCGKFSSAVFVFPFPFFIPASKPPANEPLVVYMRSRKFCWIRLGVDVWIW